MDGVNPLNEHFTVANIGDFGAKYSLRESLRRPRATLQADLFEIDFNYYLIG
ncbi:hypothetical protein [Rhizobium ecuadorense]|uniref:hypothetical protein n=1 Tax=Rhizobium ecuadorense TaxID=1671795 RepID=UPI001364BAFB|nr:hypothetical protein [Rhizobium ecuadorense]